MKHLPTFTLLAFTASLAHAETLTGKDALTGWKKDAPGLVRKITVPDLPPPYATPSAGRPPKVVERPTDSWPKVPEGFQVTEFAAGLDNPRKIITAPNGDIFVAESGADRVTVLRDTDGDGTADTRQVFADKLKQPFGMAFYPTTGEPKYLYIANTGSIVRYTYTNGQLQAIGEPEVITTNFAGGGGHWTRDIVFSRYGQKMFVSVGSRSNIDDAPEESERARIFEFTPDGKNQRLYASGIRNPSGLAIDPTTGALWTSVNERDTLGDNLVPDYITKVKDGGFYGWPWFYMGGNEDPTEKGKHPELKDTVTVPDVLLVPHSASLCLTYANAKSFPVPWQNGFFAAEHGSWNRADRNGSKVIFVPTKDGAATGEYIDFMDGFVIDENSVWGRLVGVTFDKTGALLVSDDGSNRIWRISHK